MTNYTKLLMLWCICLPYFAVSQKQFRENGYAVTRYTEEDGLKRNIINKAIVDCEGFLWLTSTYSIQKFNGRKILDNPEYDKVLFVDWTTSLHNNPQSKQLSYIKDSAILQYDHGRFKPIGRWNAAYGIVLQNGIAKVNNDFFTNPVNRTKQWFSKGAPFSEVRGFCLTKDTFVIKREGGIAFGTPQGFFTVVTQPALAHYRCRITYYKDKVIALAEKKLYVLNTRGQIVHQQNLPFAVKDTVCIAERCTNAENAYLYANNTVYALSVNNLNEISLKPVIQSSHLSLTTYVWEKDAHTIVCVSGYNGFLVYRKLPFAVATVPDKREESNFFYAQALLDSTTIFSNNAVFKNGKFIGKIDQGRHVYQQFIIQQGERFTYSHAKDIDILSMYSSAFPGSGNAVKLKAGNIYSAFADRENRIWIAGNNPDYKVGFIQNDSIRYVHKHNHWINCFFDADSVILLASVSGGLFSIHKKTHQYRSIKGFEKLVVRKITRDAKGVLWLNTYGQGLWAIHNNRLKKLNLDPKQYLLLSHSFIPDKRDRIWIPTNNGLFVVLYKELEKNLSDPFYQPFYYRFDKSAGFNTNEFNGGCNPSYIELPNGTVSLPSMNGLVSFNPSETEIRFDDSICIEQPVYDTTAVAFGKDLVFPNTSQTISFNVSTPDWHFSPMQQLLQFQLVGNNELPGKKAWQAVPENGKIAFSLLKPGHYKLIIRKRTGLNADEYVTTNIAFKIPPYWYQTNAFYAMMIFITLLVFYGFTRVRLNMLRKNNERLENAVEGAVSTLNETLKMLQGTNAQQDKLFSILSHDLRSPINNLIAVLQQSENNMLNQEHVATVLKEVKKDAASIQKTLDNILNWSMLRLGKSYSSKDHIRMQQFLKWHIKLYNKLAHDKNIHVSIECEPHIVIEADRNQIALIFRNFIDNAIKFTPHNGNIIVGVNQYGFYHTLYVANSGNPISQNAIERILYSQEIYTTPGTNREKGIGLGLQLCKEFISSMNSRLEISVNNENRYTVFSFNLPLAAQP